MFAIFLFVDTVKWGFDMFGTNTTKLAQAREAVVAGDWDRAFRIVGAWPKLGAWRDAILTAKSARLSPRFYATMGRDLAEIETAGRSAIRSLLRIS